MFSYYTSILVLCWMALVTMCILVHENNRISADDKRLLFLTYALVGISAFAEWYGVLLNGRTDISPWLIRIIKCADYILTPMAGGTLVRQMRLHNRLQKAVDSILVANNILQIVSIPGGWMVFVDEQNRYSHGPLFPVYIGLCLLIVIIIIMQFVLYGKSFRQLNRNSLYCIMILIITSILVQEIPNGFRTAYVGMTLGAALMFIHYTEYSQQSMDEKMTDQRIQLMLSQIKPHFLYNVLGSIEALCERDPQAAKLVTRKFAQYLRGNMDSLTEKKLIPFEKELQHTRLYLELEQIRFGDALQVEYDIEVHDFFLPPLTLEPIAENAVKHGIRMKPDGRGKVCIFAKEQEEYYELRVEDDGPGYDPDKVNGDESHIGIRNVRERLERICGGQLRIDPAVGQGTVVRIHVPKNQGQ